MRFNPKSKDELETMNLLNPGFYQFTVTNAEDKVSKNGREMIALTLETYSDVGNGRTIYDYLLEAVPFKLFSFCESVGLTRQYHAGLLRASDCVGKSAVVEIAIQKGREKPEGGFYADKNEVKKYMISEPSVNPKEKPPSSPQTSVPFDDDVPF